jgi:hypothetical protein
MMLQLGIGIGRVNTQGGAIVMAFPLAFGVKDATLMPSMEVSCTSS